MTTPGIKGGQGRSNREVEDASSVVFWVGLALCFLFIYLFIRSIR